jgi:hypothetical protein
MKIITFLIIAFLYAFQSNSCSPSDNNWKKISGPSDPQSVVFFFKKGTSYDERDVFYKSVISYPDPEGKGFYLREGISGTLYIRNSGYEGFAIQFSTESTPEQREKLENDIQESPIVYRVYENKVPSEIKDL